MTPSLDTQSFMSGTSNAEVEPKLMGAGNVMNGASEMPQVSVYMYCQSKSRF